MKSIKIFSGSSYQELAEEVCRILGIKLSPSRSYVYESTGCIEYQLKEDVKGRNVYLFQTFLPNLYLNHLQIWEGLQMIDAASLNGAKNITLVASYVPYARSDKIPGDLKFRPGMNISAELLIRCWQVAGVDSVIVVDPHSKRFAEFFNLDCRNYKISRFSEFHEIDSTNLIASEVGPEIAKNKENSILLTPDEGALERNLELQEMLGIKMFCAKKKRVGDDKVQSIRKGWSIKDTEGKDIYFRDDEISSGGTVKQTLNGLKSNKNFVIATHGVFSKGALENLWQIKNLGKIIVTNTLPISTEMKDRLHLRIISVADLIAKKIVQIESEIQKYQA